MRAIVGILLAAGSGRRFRVEHGGRGGGHKLLQPLPSGEPIGVTSARTLIAAVPDSLAVVRPGDAALTSALRATGLRIVEHPGADQGMGTSIAAGVRASAGAGGWLIALGDMPWIQPETIRRLAEGLASGASLVAPCYGGQRGHPVGFAAHWGGRLQALEGDIGARDLIAGAAADLVLVTTADPGVLLDIDEPRGLDSAPAGPAARPG